MNKLRHPSPRHIEPPTLPNPVKAGRDPVQLISVVACFLIALSVCLLQNLSRGSLEMARLFDSGHYLSCCEHLLNSLHQLVQDPSTACLHNLCRGLSDDLLLDGPVLPALGAMVFLVLNKVPSAIDMRTPLVLEGILHAFNASLVYIAASKLSGSRKAGLFSGLCWGLYPAAIIGSGKFLTEPLTIACLLCLILSLDALVKYKNAWSARAWLPSFLAGVLLSLSMLLKPALVIGLCIVATLAIWRTRAGKFLASTGIIAGLASILVPWMFFTQAATGHVYLTPQRKPTSNLVIGCNIETQGWGSTPETPFTTLFCDNDSCLPTALGIFSSNPQQLMGLSLQKVTRLWANPWNDYRNKLLGIPVSTQQWWHRFLLAMSALGLLFFLSYCPSQKAPLQEDRFIGYAAIALILGHLSYLAFVSSSRYGFTAMPLYLLFAGYALSCTASSKAPGRSSLTLIVLCLANILLFQSNLIPFLSFFSSHVVGLILGDLVIKCLALTFLLAIAILLIKRLRAPQPIPLSGKFAAAAIMACTTTIMLAFASDKSRLYEWSCPLKPGLAACREITLPLSTKQPEWAMIVFDGDSGSSEAQVYVNHTAVSAKPSPLYLYNSASPEAANLQLYSSVLRELPDSFRQWRAVRVPLSLLNLSGKNIVSISSRGNQQLSIYGAYPPCPGQRWHTLAFSMFSRTKLLNNFDQLEPRLPDILPLVKTESKNWLADTSRHTRFDDLSASPGRQFGQYRIFLALGYAPNNSQQTIPLSKQETASEGSKTHSLQGQLSGPIKASAATGFSRADRIPGGLCDLGHIEISIQGQLKAQNLPTALLISAAVHSVSGMGDALYVPGTPLMLNTDSHWLPFQIKGELPCANKGSQSLALQLIIAPSKYDVVIKDLLWEIQAEKEPDFANGLVTVL